MGRVLGWPVPPITCRPLGYVPRSCTRSAVTHCALPQVRPEPRRGRPHLQADRKRASQAACASNSAIPSGPGTETTGRMRPPGSASHSRGLSAAGPPGAGPIVLLSPFLNPASPRPGGSARAGSSSAPPDTIGPGPAPVACQGALCGSTCSGTRYARTAGMSRETADLGARQSGHPRKGSRSAREYTRSGRQSEPATPVGRWRGARCRRVLFQRPPVRTPRASFPARGSPAITP